MQYQTEVSSFVASETLSGLLVMVCAGGVFKGCVFVAGQRKG